LIKINSNFLGSSYLFDKVQYFPKFCNFESSLNFDTFVFLSDKLEESVFIEQHGKLKIELFEKTFLGEQIITELNNCFDLNNKKIDLHLYGSIIKKGLTYNHIDREDVLLIGAFGKVIYNIYSEELGKFNSITLEEGDLLIIPKNIEHSAIPLCPRIVISVGIY
jgi:hypothetical protein